MPKPVQKNKTSTKKSTTRKPSSDPNRRAHQMLQEHLERAGEAETAPSVLTGFDAALKAYMSALGTKGGKASGVSRMHKLSPTRRREIAAKAARDRWQREKAGKTKT